MDIWETEIREHSGLRYKIQMRNNQGLWQQRHVWYPCETTEPAYGGVVNHYHEDEWIKSGTGTMAPDAQFKRVQAAA